MSPPAFNHPWAPCGPQKLIVPPVHHAASHLPAFPHAAPPAPIALLLLLHLANSSFETPLRGQLREALPAPPRLGKMLPVCLHHRTHHVCRAACSCACPPTRLCSPRGQDRLLLFTFVALAAGPIPTSENVFEIVC